MADVLLVRQELLTQQPEVAEKVARVWFAGAAKGDADKQAAAKFNSSTVPRFKTELGYDGTVNAFTWVKWTNISDNRYFFGLDGKPPAFDRVYNQADGIWVQYPKAEIKERFTPAGLRNDSIVRRIAQAQTQSQPVEQPKYEPKVAATGAPLFTKPVTINFQSGQSELDSESMHILNTQVIPQLELARAMSIRVEGNTDDVGEAQQNQGLSDRRAKSVLDYLVQRGVVKDRVTAKGNGDGNPVASNKTTDGRAANRRTDILFINNAPR